MAKPMSMATEMNGGEVRQVESRSNRRRRGAHGATSRQSHASDAFVVRRWLLPYFEVLLTILQFDAAIDSGIVCVVIGCALR